MWVRIQLITLTIYKADKCEILYTYSVIYPYFSSSKFYAISRAPCVPSQLYMKTAFDSSAAEPQHANN